MRAAVYNLGIPNAILNSVNRISRTALQLADFAMQLSFVVLAFGNRCGRHRLERARAATGAQDCCGHRARRSRPYGREPFFPREARQRDCAKRSARCARRARASFCKSRAVGRHGRDFAFRESCVLRLGGGDSPRRRGVFGGHGVAATSCGRDDVPRVRASQPAQDLIVDAGRSDSRRCRARGKCDAHAHRRARRGESFALPDAEWKMAGGADGRYRPCAAMAAGYARKADCGEEIICWMRIFPESSAAAPREHRWR